MGRYSKLGKPDRELKPSDLDRGLRLFGWMPLEYKAYAALVFWTGCRRAEPLGTIKKEDISITESFIYVRNLPAFKGGHRAESIRLNRGLVGVDLLRELAHFKKKGESLFTFSHGTAYNIIMTILQVYPHHLRYNRVTALRRSIDSHKISTDDAKAFTGIRSDRTMQGYGITSEEGAQRASDSLG